MGFGRAPEMTTITLILALIFTVGIVFITGALASRYGVDPETWYLEN